jgi:methylase of polypeptide subunit release factors
LITIKNIQNFNFEEVPIDSFWNTGNQKEQKMHRIHAYPAKFPAFITTKALEYANSIELSPKRIGDIFCGCGTTAYEAKRNHLDFWGCDINPVATLIARTKSNNYDSEKLDKYFEAIVKDFNQKIKNINYNIASERLKYWFYEEEYNNLYHLKSILLKHLSDDQKYRDFFLCAFSNILKPTSKWLTKSIKPQIDPNKKPADVLEAFAKQYKKMKIANDEQSDFSDSQADIITGNFLNNEHTPPNIDLIITSPPYVTSYEYADLHQLSSLWLDYVDDYRELRDGTIGSLHHEYNFNKELKRLNSTGYKIVSLLLDQHKSKAKSVAKYFLDMQTVAKKSHSILSSNGMVLFVIGNTEYKNIRIDNAKHLSESLYGVGFQEVSVTKRKISRKILTPYRDKRGKFTTNSKGRKVYSEEFIIIGRKNK